MSKETKRENPLLAKNIPPPPAPIQETKEVTKSDSAAQDKTVLPPHAAKPHPARPSRAKLTFYLEQLQEDKLYDLMEAYRRRTGVKINQQDMLRRIIEVVKQEDVLP